MKKFAWFLILFLALTPLTGCDSSDSGDDSTSGGGGGDEDGDDDTKYNMSNLPSKFSVEIPKSLKSTASRSLTRSTEQSKACEELKSNISYMESDTMMIGQMAVMADAAISQNELTADETAHTVDVTLTQAMVDKILELMGDEADMISEEMQNYVGQSESITVTYSDAAEAPYKYSVEIEFDEDKNTLYWNEEKTKTKLVTPVTFVEMNSNGDETESEGTCVIVFDGDTNIQTSNYEANSIKMDMSLQTTADGNGAIFFSNSQSPQFTSRMEGFADDNGGYVVSTWISNGQAPQVTKESFDAAGYIIESDSTYSSAYGDYSSEVETLVTEIGGVAVPAADLTSGDEYIVLKAQSADLFGTDLIGYGVVNNGKLYVQDIGGAAYASLASSGTLYLYKMTVADDGSVSVAEVAIQIQNTAR